MKQNPAVTSRSDVVRYQLEILLASFAGLLLEISYTRIVSFKLYYYWTYLVIGLALLGIGAGGVYVAISSRLRRATTDSILLWSFLLGAVSVGVGYVVVAITSLDTLAIWDYGTLDSFENLGRLTLICVAVFASFVAIGVIVATLFARRSEQIGRLYFADLVGASIACAVVVSLLGSIGPPATIILAGLVLALTGLRVALRLRSRVMPVIAAVALLLIVGVVAPSTVLPEQREDATKVDVRKADTIFSEWSPIVRVDVIRQKQHPEIRLVLHDGLKSSAIYRFNGNPSSLTRFDTDSRSLPFAVRGSAPKRVLIIGAAGGNETLASLYYRAAHIDAVELDPVTYDLVTHDFADYTGHFTENPRVNYVQGDGRSYLARSGHRYDLVWFAAPDSYAASNAASSGAFVLSESYLYTSEAITNSLEHLGRGGVLAVQFGELDYKRKPNRTARYVSTARHALAALGINDPTGHFLVATAPTGVGGSLSTILIKRLPFTTTEVDRFVSGLEQVRGSTLRYAPGHRDQGGNHVVSSLITAKADALDAFYDSYSYDVRPITDDSPFFWHFVPFSTVIRHADTPIDRIDPEAGLGERVLLLLLVVAIVLAAIFLLLPFRAIREAWAAFPHKPRSALYFGSLGLGFIFFEITLIQRLILFLGYPTYSLTVTLMSLLIFTGIGALLSGRYDIAVRERPNRVLAALLGVITLLTVFYEFALVPMNNALLGLPLAARVPIAFVVLAPLGLCLGAFMPIGLGVVARITTFPREYVAWGWAVNGFSSVIGSVLSTILAMSFGFRVVLVFALLAYVVALAALRGLLGTAGRTPVPSGP